MSTPSLQYRTTDGDLHETRGLAIRHQRKLDAIADFANLMEERFGLDKNVSCNIAAEISANTELLGRMLGKRLTEKTSEKVHELAGEATAAQGQGVEAAATGGDQPG